MTNLEDIIKKVIEFRDARDWKQFHNPKDAVISLMLEAAEVAEHFQWKSAEEMDRYVVEHKDAVAEELVDTLYWILLLAHDLNIDLPEAFEKKMAKNALKYPIDRSKGNHTKYTEL